MRAGSRDHRRRRATRSGEPPPGQPELPATVQTAWTAGLRVRAVPVESFTVVMATGIVAVAARDNGQTFLATALAALVAQQRRARGRGRRSGSPCEAERRRCGVAR